MQAELPESLKEATTLRVSLDSPEQITPFDQLFSRVSSWLSLIKIVKVVLDFINRASERAALKSGKQIAAKPRASTELATKIIISAVQRSSFPRCFPSLPSPPPKNLVGLCPIFEESILKVGGRLRHSQLTHPTKFPILLPPDSPVTLLLMRHFHSLTNHQGRVVTMAAIREAGYYINRGTGAVKKFIHNCVTCKKLRGSLLEQRMNDLPYDRLESCPPFTYCGMDVFGHYHVSDGITTRRNLSLIHI